MKTEVPSSIDPHTVTARWGMKVHIISREEPESPLTGVEEGPPALFPYEAFGRDMHVPIYAGGGG
jgi:hypothetical protein